MKSFKTPDIIITGGGSLEECGPLLRSFGQHAFVVTGPHVGKSEAFTRLTAVLVEAGVAMTVFDGITGEPTVPMIDAGGARCREAGCNFIVGVGGGSPLDAAKAIAAMLVNNGDISSFMGKEIGGALPPVVCIPTTAGTGSEATKFTIITDPATDVKMLLKGDALLPRAAIVDYTLGTGAPPHVIAATGLDALTHAIEAYLSVKAQPLTDVLCLSAIHRIMLYLPMAYANPNDSLAREEMALAALEAGICINNSSVTVVHGMSRPVGALFHVPHGLSNAMLLTTCLRHLSNTRAARRMAEIAIHVRLAGLDVPQLAASLVSSVSEVIAACEVSSLKGYGIDERQFAAAIPKMSRDAVASGSPANSPAPFTPETLAKLYAEAYQEQ